MILVDELAATGHRLAVNAATQPRLLRRDREARTEFVTFTLWDSLEAIRASPATMLTPPFTTLMTIATSSNAT